jgi:hypothetical protein
MPNVPTHNPETNENEDRTAFEQRLKALNEQYKGNPGQVMGITSLEISGKSDPRAAIEVINQLEKLKITPWDVDSLHGRVFGDRYLQSSIRQVSGDHGPVTFLDTARYMIHEKEAEAERERTKWRPPTPNEAQLQSAELFIDKFVLHNENLTPKAKELLVNKARSQMGLWSSAKEGDAYRVTQEGNKITIAINQSTSSFYLQ